MKYIEKISFETNEMTLKFKKNEDLSDNIDESIIDHL